MNALATKTTTANFKQVSHRAFLFALSVKNSFSSVSTGLSPGVKPANNSFKSGLMP